jgi:hypothetical protein
MKVTYSKGVPISIYIYDTSYHFKTYTSKSNKKLYSVDINGLEFCHDYKYSLFVKKNDSIEDVYVSAERKNDENYSGESEFHQQPSYIIYYD